MLFTAFAGLALVSFLRKSERLKLATLVASVPYLGFYKSPLISIVNVFRLITWNLPVVKSSLAWYVFAVFTRGNGTVGTPLLRPRLRLSSTHAAHGPSVPARLRIELPRKQHHVPG